MQRRYLAFLLCWVVFDVGAAGAETTARTDVRQHLRFDNDWRFRKGDVEGAQQPRFDDDSWRRFDLPHDWSIEDLPVLQEEQAGPSPLHVVEGEWRFRKGDDMNWKSPALDDGAWESVRLPASWERHSEYTEPNAYGWYRRKIVVPATRDGEDLLLALGKIDDVDQTFFNGVLIGSTGAFPPDYESRWQEDRLYRVPQNLVRFGRENVIAVRVYDGSGDGGLYAATGPRRRSGPFDSAAPGARSTGYTVGGIAWYRKHFRLPSKASGKRVAIRFDGVYMNADVWINGVALGNHPYGYTSFGYDLTTHLNRAGQDNVLAVRVRNEGKNSRWYSGSGIYRHVWLTITDPVHVAPWGTYVTTAEVAKNAATVVVRTQVVNHRPSSQNVEVAVHIVDPQGRSVVEQTQMGRIAADPPLDTTHRLQVPNPALWSPESPSLYEAVTEVRLDGEMVDRTHTPFGIRTLAFDSRSGFLLNGRPTLLRGGCMHHDNGPLGAAAYDRAEERRVELMKAAGFNAIRCAHNPPSPAFLDACDRLGMLVIDEAFDHWNRGKNSEDYHLYFEQWWRRDIESMVLRDRNHPCVIMWSIGNEVLEQHEPLGAQTAKALGDYVRL
ncbi:MAG: beta galactosidase jelly roll domain-containing protein, partial [Sedimentisphaerales bacterium]|nr:beta galactosidase jelly roll domain-containing protein [Sedimentisphaerales bacterium]